MNPMMMMRKLKKIDQCDPYKVIRRQKIKEIFKHKTKGDKVITRRIKEFIKDIVMYLKKPEIFNIMEENEE